MNTGRAHCRERALLGAAWRGAHWTALRSLRDHLPGGGSAAFGRPGGGAHRTTRWAFLAALLACLPHAAAQGEPQPAGAPPEPPEPTPFSAAAPDATPPAPWRHQPLPKVKRENRFDLVAEDGGVVLRVRSEASASTLAHPLDADPQQTPLLEWRWKVSNPVAGSDFTRKAGDDYAGRVYVLFDYPVERLAFVDRVKIALARSVHGAELPAAALAYVWGTAQPAGAMGPNPHTDRVRMIVVESGAARAGQWLAVQRDLAADFQAAFGEPAPRITGIAVSADTDNTGEAVTTWFGDLRLRRRAPGEPRNE